MKDAQSFLVTCPAIKIFQEKWRRLRRMKSSVYADAMQAIEPYLTTALTFADTMLIAKPIALGASSVAARSDV